MRFNLLTSFALLLVGLSGISISGCETLGAGNSSGKPITIAPLDGLRPQELAAGECGIFLWSSSKPRTFIFFHKQGEQQAKYHMQGTVITLQTDENTIAMNDSTHIKYTYSGANFEAVILKGILTEELENGRRISNATIKTKKIDAWEEIHPVSGVYVCR